MTAMEQAVKASATTAAKEAAMDASVSTLRTKADVFIYGLALSKVITRSVAAIAIRDLIGEQPAIHGYSMQGLKR